MIEIILICAMVLLSFSIGFVTGVLREITSCDDCILGALPHEPELDHTHSLACARCGAVCDKCTGESHE